ncbi:MAG: electron transport complex subunit RsxC [Gammaproteobacteria bacterium]|nr:electron transport complex subunit RsxC [Gammaproteobacteria bacterium]
MSSEAVARIARLKLRPHRIFGGIKPRAYKSSSLRSRILPCPIPDQLILSLRQHQGEAASPVVKVGDMVLKFQLLAEAENDSALNLHAPTSGKITAIAPHAIPGQSGQPELCVFLETDKQDAEIELTALPDYRAMSHLELLDLISQAGICGLGGAGFPSGLKLGDGIEKEIGLLIINAAECEPYITADEALLREFAEEVVSGAEILQKISLAPQCVIAIEKDKQDAIAALKPALRNSSIKLIALSAKYPTGGEKQIIQGVTGLEVPTGGLPQDIGVLVHNAGTAFAVHKAIIFGEPCVSRITTLTGAPLQTPKNFEALIGTPASYLLKICGLDKKQLTGAIVGGSIMGVELKNFDSPLLKTSNCIIAKSAKEFPQQAKEQACIRCGYCANVCPAQLLPQQLYAYSRSNDRLKLQDYGLADCIECGACAYVCPSNIPLVQYYRASKQEIKESMLRERQSEYWQSRFQTHQYRLKKNQEDKLSKRKKKKSAAGTKTENTFSREKARAEIAAAVERVKARKKKLIASTKLDK